jgi:hypothetical protein
MSDINERPLPMAKIRERLQISESHFSAIKNKMGLRHVRFGLMSAFTKFFQENPNFKQVDVYHRPDCPCGGCLEKRARPGARRGRPRVGVAAAV